MAEANMKDYIPTDRSAPDPERAHFEAMWAMLEEKKKKRGASEEETAMLAALRAVAARKAGKPHQYVPDAVPQSKTFSIATTFPEIVKEMTDATEALRADAFTAGKKEQKLSFSAADRDYHAGLAYTLFEIAIEKCARTMHALKQSRNHIAELEGRITALEKATVVAAHRGTFAAGKSYSEGTLITHSGSLWLAARHTNDDERPGSSDAWRLVVKRGHANKAFE